jgi:HEPN domain-containing protein
MVLDIEARFEVGRGSGAMNTKLMALDYIKRARSCFRESKAAFDEEDYPITVRRAQECVELCLKAVLRSIAIEYPKEHDVSKALKIAKEKIPDWFSSKIQKFMDISLDLSKKRGPALYGYEAEFKPASEVFSEKDAKEALASAEEVFVACNKLTNEIFGINNV